MLLIHTSAASIGIPVWDKQMLQGISNNCRHVTRHVTTSMTPMIARKTVLFRSCKVKMQMLRQE